MTKDLTSGSPMKLIVSFVLPILAGLLFQQLYNLVDTMIVGRTLGMMALAGVGATGSINFLVIGFCNGCCSGFSIPVAQQFGAGEYRKMREFAANSVYVCAAIGAVLTAMTVVLCGKILTVMNTPAECYEEAYRYIVVIFAGIPATFFYNLLSGWLRSLGDSKTPLFFLILSSILNVFLDLLLILVFRMGVTGASLATVVSQAVSGFLCLIWIIKKVPTLYMEKEAWQPKRSRAAELCSCGIPMGLQYSVTGIGSAILQSAVNSLGATAVAAVAAASKVHCFLECPFEALGTTSATFTAQNVGAGKLERVGRGVRDNCILGFAWSAVAFTVVLLFGRNLTGLFVTGNEEEMLSLAQTYLIYDTACYPLLTFVNVVRFAIQGMGFTILSIVSGAFEMVARSMCGFFLVPLIGFRGAALGHPSAWIAADCFLIPAFFLCRKRMEKKTLK